MADKTQFFSVEECLEKNIPEEQLKEVKRILFGKQLESVFISVFYYLSNNSINLSIL